MTLLNPPSAPARPSLCFVNLDAYPALVPGYESHRIGGEEVQHSLLSTMFAAKGYDVHLVTADFGQPDGQAVRGVRVLRSFRAEAGLPVVRFVHPRWTGLHAALRRANSDVYYVSCAGALVGWVAWFARRHRRRVIFRVASDTDCDPNRLLVTHARDRWLYHYGLHRADAVLAQTDHQVALLKANYGIQSVVAPMVLDVPVLESLQGERDIDVLWVANMRVLKRPELFVQLAQQLPNRRFHLVGGSMRDEPEVYARVCSLAAAVPNLTLHGRVGFHDTLALVNRARLFVSTSLIEGFPNTFLQAWAREVPTVSFFDPDGLVTRHGLGLRADTSEQMRAQIDALLSDPTGLANMSASCGRFMRQRYERNELLQPYAAVFSSPSRAASTP
ncbi:MAG: glycosyltransferase family 4 protein [Rhizobacter sp.]